MYYLHIPIKTKEDGKKIAEDYFGAMVWRCTGIISIEAYPHDNENPVRIDASQPSVKADAEGCARCGESFDKHCVIDHHCVGYKARTA